MPKLIVSYRRSDSAASAGRIVDHLVAHFGQNSVFLDVENIPFGTDFRTHIRNELLHSDVLLAVIGPRWSGAGPDGRTRLDDESDPVRVEIQTALRSGITIVPLLIDDATMPTANQLPEALRDLAFLNAAPVDMGRDFHPHMDRLTRSLENLAAAAPQRPIPVMDIAPSGSVPGPSARRRPVLAAAAAIVLAAGLGIVGGWSMAGSATLAPPPAVGIGGPGESPAARTTKSPGSARMPDVEPPATTQTTPSRRGKAHGVFAWYELWTTDAPAASRFYHDVVGWEAKSWGVGEAAYTMLSAGPMPIAGLATLPAALASQGVRSAWIGYVAVTDVDASVAEVRALGGTVYRAPADVPNVGRYALVADPQGAVFALFKGMADPPPPPSPLAPGYSGWRELQATDRDAAFAFYASLFGWTKAEVPGDDPSGARPFSAGSTVIGDVREKPATSQAPAWTYSFQVASLGAASTRVQAGGGTVAGLPRQMPNGAWTVACLDPSGAPFALTSTNR